MTRPAALVVLAALLAGCGGAASQPARRPQLPRTLAATWRSQAEAVAAALAAGDGCLARDRAAGLRDDVIAAVNARRIPPRFQEPLLGAVNDLAARIACTPPPPPAPPPPAEHGHDHGHGHGHGHGKHGGDG